MNRLKLSGPRRSVSRSRHPGWILLLLGTLTWHGCAGTPGSDRYEALTEDYRDHEAVRAHRLAAAPPDQALFRGTDRLQRTALVRAVLDRNPGVEASRQAWRAALARSPQAGVFEDPVIRYEFAPLSIGSDRVDYGQEVAVSQPLPFFGKRGLRAALETAQAEAAAADYRTVQHRMAAVTSQLYDVYYLTARSVDINREHLRLMQQLLDAATARYTSGQATQPEPLRAEVELGHLSHRELQLEAELDIVRAQINALLHRPADAPLPPPPAALELPEVDPAWVLVLDESAPERRPELAAWDARLRGVRAQRDLADRTAWPDFALMTSYSTMWRETDHRWMVGLAFSVPIWGGGRDGAREEADARRTELEHRREETLDQVRYEIDRGLTRIAETRAIIRLFDRELLPASRDQVVAARAGYETGVTAFETWIDAQRNLRDVELGYERALTNYFTARAELERAAGRLPELPESETLR